MRFKYINYNLVKSVISLFNRLLMCVLLVLMVVTAFTVITSKTSKLFGFQSYTVLTGSMNPTIPAGSVIYALPVEKYSKDDIVTFKHDGVNITHRIVGFVNEKGESVSQLISPISGVGTSGNFLFKTKGDANKSQDSFNVQGSEITGRVITHVPEAGKFITQLKKPQGFLLAVILPALIYISFELWAIKKEIEKKVRTRVLKELGLL